MSRRSTSRIALPWERQGSVRDVVLRSRYKALLTLLFVGLAGVTLYQHYETRRAEATTLRTLFEVRSAYTRFRALAGRCPESMEELVRPQGHLPRLLPAVRTDAWGHALYIECPSHLDPDDVEVLSAGRSGDFFRADNLSVLE